MTDNRKSGIALIAGSLGGIITMAVHPSGAGPLPPAQLDHLVVASAFAHSLALLSNFVLVLGALGLTLKLATATKDRLALSGFVAYCFAAVAIFIAAAVSGFIVLGLMRNMAHDTPASAPAWHIVIYSIFQFNQVFANIYALAVSAAIVLWSSSALRNGGLSKGLAIYGCILAPILLFAIGSGHLVMNVHGMAIVVVAQAIWFILAGATLYDSEIAL